MHKNEEKGLCGDDVLYNDHIMTNVHYLTTGCFVHMTFSSFFSLKQLMGIVVRNNCLYIRLTIVPDLRDSSVSTMRKYQCAIIFFLSFKYPIKEVFYLLK